MMPEPLSDGAVEFPDGTPATVTQMSRDITEFLQWTYFMHQDRQKNQLLFLGIWTVSLAGCMW